jgi:translation elongation factor EF-G
MRKYLIALLMLVIVFGGAFTATWFAMDDETPSDASPVLTTAPDETSESELTQTPSESATESQNSANDTLTATVTCSDAGACNADIQLWCPDEWSGENIEASWKLDLVRCLYDEHKDDISAGCRTSLECRQTLNETLVTACQQDKRTYCSGVMPTPGSEPLVDCLEEHFDNLSTACAQAWVNHEYAKPE